MSILFISKQFIYLFFIFVMFSGCAKMAFNNSQELDTVKAYNKFILEYPDKPELVLQAKSRVEELKFQHAKNDNTLEAINSFMEEYPVSEFWIEARQIREPLYWKWIKAKNSLAQYDAFMKDYQNSKYIEEAMKLREPLFWSNIIRIDRVFLYEKYLNDYPKGKYSNQAKENIDKIIWKKNNTTISGLEYYLHYYPKGIYLQRAKKKLEKKRWEALEYTQDIQRVQKYITTYPYGLFYNEAQEKLEMLYYEKFVENTKNITDIKLYIDFYPHGKFIKEAQEKIEYLTKITKIRNNKHKLFKIVLAPVNTKVDTSQWDGFETPSLNILFGASGRAEKDLKARIFVQSKADIPVSLKIKIVIHVEIKKESIETFGARNLISSFFGVGSSTKRTTENEVYSKTIHIKNLLPNEIRKGEIVNLATIGSSESRNILGWRVSKSKVTAIRKTVVQVY